MTRFLLLNFKDFGLNQDITQTIQTQALLCICCLEKNVPLINLSTCKHNKYLDGFSIAELVQSKKVICFQCHEILKKIEKFRQQVEYSLTLLLTKSSDTPETENVKKVCIQKTVDIYLPPEKYVPILTLHPEENNLGRATNTLSETEGLKIECGSVLPVKSELKDETDVRSNSVAATKKVIQEIQQHRKKGKVKLVKLTKEELMKERLQTAQSAQYLKHPYRCKHCIIGFNYEENVKDHMARKHAPKEDSVTCDICQTVLQPPGSLTVHYYRHLTRYDCESCGERFPAFDDALQHYNRTHETAISHYKCQFCSYSTEYHDQFKYHKFKHKKRYCCKDCGTVLATSASLRRHMTIIHKKPAHNCSVWSSCGRGCPHVDGVHARPAGEHTPREGDASALQVNTHAERKNIS